MSWLPAGVSAQASRTSLEQPQAEVVLELAQLAAERRQGMPVRRAASEMLPASAACTNRFTALRSMCVLP
ncbi:MAG: hypothetical protein H6730_05220 [Deltaproteobacteria bacterium]|nr:hypothetical protein [Deltaproteobacteria bacterium]